MIGDSYCIPLRKHKTLNKVLCFIKCVNTHTFLGLNLKYNLAYLLYLRLSLTKFEIQSRIKGYSISCILFSSLTWKSNFGLEK